jgi:SH3-like domain-containing protein
VKKGEALSVTAEFGAWRHVQDIKNEGGWVHSSVLSGKRSVIIISSAVQALRKNPEPSARIIAKISPELRCQFKKCKAAWCQIKCSGHSGWIEKKYLWGIYESE